MAIDTAANNRRIAKNTLMLYFRMLFSMVVSLYTSRVVLNALGVEDYGIYNVVGGLVSMFSVISGSLSASILRFITYELGCGDKNRLNKIFSTSINIQFGLGLIIIILAETVGIWFLNAKMNISDVRMMAANWVFQFSILTFVVNLVSVPYNASIIAHEHMSAFAYISILEAILKLSIAFLIFISPIDQLVFYALLMTLTACIIRFVYSFYCKKHFKESKFQFYFSKKLLFEMFSFAGWNTIGSASAILRDQGGNILLNLFFNPAVNAARGVSIQACHAITLFAQNFMTAVNPQITKSYASGDKEYLTTLLFQSSRFSFYLLSVLSIPILIKAEYILSLWLGNVPEHSTSFIQLMILFSLNESFSYSLITAMLATGDVKNYQIIVGGLLLLNVPISYITLKLGAPPESVFIVSIVLSIASFATRLIMLKRMIQLPIKLFLLKVYLKCILVFVLSAIIPIILSYFLRNSIPNLILLCTASILSSFTFIYTFGCTANERVFIRSKISAAINSHFRKL